MINVDNSRIISFLKVILILELVFSLLYTHNISIDYQDTWTLSGIEWIYAIIVVSIIAYFCFEDDNKSIIFFSILIRVALILIPITKYAFFPGRNMDQHIQYNLVTTVLNTGKIADISQYYGLTSQYYVGVPLLHLSISIFTMILGIPSYLTFKYIPAIWSISYPLITYSIMKESKLIDNKFLYKLGIFISTIPFSASGTAVITGSLFVSILTYYYLSQILKAIDPPSINIKDLFLFLFFIIGSILSHSIYTLHFLLLLASVMVLLQILRLLPPLSLAVQLIIAAFLFDMAWITYQTIPLKILTSFLRVLGIKKSVPQALITLTFSDILSTFKVFALIYGTDILISGFILLSIVILLRNNSLRSNYKKIYPFFITFIIVTWFMTIFGFVTGITYGYWARVLRISYFFYPFTYGIFLFEQTYIKNKNIIMPVFFSLIMIFSTIQYNRPPAFIPPASILSPLLPEDEPLVYRGEVNSIYQRNLIEFSQNNLNGRIACDAVTRNQIIGLTRNEWSKRSLLWYYPLWQLTNPNFPDRDFEFFLIHMPGASGSFEEPAVIRVKNVIVAFSFQDHYDLIYSNGASLILANRE